jgi:hypothetical protein
MLLLRERTQTINNITFFADDSDDKQFWYLPGDIHIAENDKKPVFSLIKYTGDGSGQQGGYINFEVNYLSKLKVDPKTARKTQVMFDKGTVNFFVLGAEGTNGELISAQSPSLFGKNSAIFSAKLTPEEILKSFFTASLSPNDDSNTQAKSASSSILDSLIASDKKEDEEGGKGGLFPSASLEIKMVRIEETKALNFNYISSQAITQAAVPQNFIGSDILRAKKVPPYFIEVNVNDPFFQKIDFTVLGPDGFDEYGIKAASFKIGYNNQVYTAPPFTADDGTWGKNISRSKNTNELFDIQSEFIFKSAAASGWEGSSSYQPKSQSASTLLNLDPGSVLTFNEISIFLDKKFSWENCNQLIVELAYTDDKQSKKSKKYTFSEDKSEAQTFKYRCLTEKPWNVNYKITYFLVGGKTTTLDGSENPPAIVIPAVA